MSLFAVFLLLSWLVELSKEINEKSESLYKLLVLLFLVDFSIFFCSLRLTEAALRISGTSSTGEYL